MNDPKLEKAARDHLSCVTEVPLSPVAVRVAMLLHAWVGLHHLDPAALKKVQWSNPLFIQLQLNHQFSSGQLATHDFDGLTALVFLAHDHCIRVDISPFGKTHFLVQFHPREGREGGMAKRHPTLEQAVAQWRERHSDVFEQAATAAAS